MYKNENYRRLFEKGDLLELPEKADSVMVGPHAVVRKISIECEFGPCWEKGSERACQG